MKRSLGLTFFFSVALPPYDGGGFRAQLVIALDGDGDDQLQLQQFRPMAIAKSCSLTDLLNTVDYAALSHLLLDGAGAGPSSPRTWSPPARRRPCMPRPASSRRRRHGHCCCRCKKTASSFAQNTPGINSADQDVTDETGSRWQQAMMAMRTRGQGRRIAQQNKGQTNRL